MGDGAVGDPASDSDDWAGYPGFTKATAEIADALDQVPSRPLLHVDADFWTDHDRPQARGVKRATGPAGPGDVCDGRELSDDRTGHGNAGTR